MNMNAITLKDNDIYAVQRALHVALGAALAGRNDETDELIRTIRIGIQAIEEAIAATR